MKLGPPILALLEKTYEADSLIETNFQRYDLAFKTDESGKPILLFIGKKDAQGKIKGERFARQPKGHWDNKGKIS
jgi:hypothetical protein